MRYLSNLPMFDATDPMPLVLRRYVPPKPEEKTAEIEDLTWVLSGSETFNDNPLGSGRHRHMKAYERAAERQQAAHDASIEKLKAVAGTPRTSKGFESEDESEARGALQRLLIVHGQAGRDAAIAILERFCGGRQPRLSNMPLERMPRITEMAHRVMGYLDAGQSIHWLTHWQE